MRGGVLGVALLAFVTSCGPAPLPPPSSTCPNNAPASCPSAHPVYADVQPVLAANCEACHSAGGVSASIPLTSFTQVHARRGAVLDQVLNCLMPLQGAPALTSTERVQLLTWLVCDAPE